MIFHQAIEIMRLITIFLGSSTSVSDQEIISNYVSDFIQISQDNVNQAYNLLDEEYRNKKFGNIENFKNYLLNNLDKMQNSALTKYGKNIKENYTEYYYMDTNNDMFIIRKAENKEDYSILLDEYTIKGDDYLNGYEKYTEEQKIYNNIFIFFRMINEKEYNSAYNLLDETFRANNFDTVDKFQEYAKNNFWNNNILTITKIQKQGDIYTGLFKIASGVGVSAAEKSKTFAIQLKENAEFVMSFGV